MADYSQDAIDFYNDLKEDGGPVTVYFPQLDPDSLQDQAQPWKGTDADADSCQTFGLFVPENTTVVGRARVGNICYIPGYKLEVNGEQRFMEQDCTIKMANGNEWRVSAAPELNLDGRLPIYFLCQVTKWPVS